LNLIKAKAVALYKQNLGRRQFYQFPNLSSVETNDDDILVFCQDMDAHKEHFANRFQDVLNMIIPELVLEPFSNLQTADLSLQEELIELSTNEE
jgi:hypothetical protein